MSIDFIIRLIGMVVFTILGVIWGVSLGKVAQSSTASFVMTVEQYAFTLGLVGALTETPFEEARKLFEVNFFGALRLMQLGLKTMERQGWGVIINVASLAGLFPSAYIPVYNASKAALISLSESTSIEYFGTRIKVVAFCPGTVETEFSTSQKNFGRIKKLTTIDQPMSAETTAEQLVHIALKPKPLVAPGIPAKLGRITRALIPSAYYAAVKSFRTRIQQANPPENDSE
jgi:short-subunit dehydrogenase